MFGETQRQWDFQKAIIVRIVFALHNALCVYQCCNQTGNNSYWFLLLLNILAIAETYHCIYFRGGHELEWVSPGAMIYIINTAPTVWIMQLSLLGYVYSANQTIYGLDGGIGNDTIDRTYLRKEYEGPLIQIWFNRDLDEKIWTTVLVEVMFVLLIVGRWGMPCHYITHKELTEMLFAFIGIMADIIDLLYLFDTDNREGVNVIKRDYPLVVTILTSWTVSLVQFILTLTHHSKKPLIQNTDEDDPTKQGWCACCETEIFSVLVEVLVQDGPFFTIRLFIFSYKDVVDYTVIFYTLKNALIILLEIYHIVAIIGSRNDRVKHFYNRMGRWRKEHGISSEFSLSSDSLMSSSGVKPTNRLGYG